MRARHVLMTAAASVAVGGVAAGVSESQTQLPSTPATPTWEAPVDLGTGRSPAGISVAVGDKGDIGVLVASTVRKGVPATLSLRRAAPGAPLGGPLTLERAADTFGPAALTFDSTRRAVAAWDVRKRTRRRIPAAITGAGDRLHVARLSSAATVDVVELTDGSSPVYQPTFVPGLPGPALGWGEGTGPIRVAQWGAGRAPRHTSVALPVTGFEGSAGAGAPGGRVLSTYILEDDVVVSASKDGGKTYAPPVVVSRLKPQYLFPFIAVGRDGSGVITWNSYERGSGPAAPGPAHVYAAVVPAGGTRPGEARRLSDPTLDVSPPSVVPGVDGGGMVGWVEGTVARVDRLVNGISTGRTVDGALRVARLDADGTPTLVTLGRPGEVASSMRLLTDGSGGAVAVWTTPDDKLRSQSIDATGAAGPAYTLARGIVAETGFTAAGANGLVAVTYRAGGRLHLRVLR